MRPIGRRPLTKGVDMSLAGPLLIILLGVLALAGVVLLVLLLVRPETTGLDRAQLRARRVGVIAGVLIAAALLAAVPLPGRLGLGALAGTAPLLGAAALVLAVLIGEGRLAAPIVGASRSADLEPHGLREVLPCAASLAAAAAVLGLGALMVMTTVLASPDDVLRPGRVLTGSGTDASGVTIEIGIAPYPGSWYTIPAAIALVLLVLLAALALRAVTARRPGGVGGDLLARRRSAATVIGAVMIGTGLLGVVLGGLAATRALGVAGGLGDMGADVPTAVVVSGVLALLAAIGGVAVTGWGAVLVLAPALAARRDTSRRALRLPAAPMTGTAG